MKTKKWALTFLVVFAGMVLFTAQSALGGCEVTSLDALIDLDNAPKTKYEGPITLYFHPVWGVDGDGNPVLVRTDAYLFLRLRKGSQLFAFSDVIQGVELLDFINDPLVVESFFEGTVLKGLYPAVCPGVDCPPAVLKSYDLDVSHDDPPGGSLLEFFVVDIILAVQD